MQGVKLDRSICIRRQVMRTPLDLDDKSFCPSTFHFHCLLGFLSRPRQRRT
jgi:hypothetical protein